jgi:inorganic pyrophosphatase
VCAIYRSVVILRGRVIGGLHVFVVGQGVDQFVAVRANDMVWQDAKDICDLPAIFVVRLRHYFESFKLGPGQPPPAHIELIYGAEHAFKVIRAAMLDYEHEFGG